MYNCGRFLFLLLVASELLCISVFAQSKEELYRLDFAYFESVGNEPKKVDAYWIRIGQLAYYDFKKRARQAQGEPESLFIALSEHYGPDREKNETDEEVRAVANKTFRLLNDAGVAEKYVFKHLKSRLQSKYWRERQNARGRSNFDDLLRQFLTRYEVQRMLGISPEQGEKISKAIASSKVEYRNAIAESEAFIRVESDEMFSQMLNLLDEGQRNLTLSVCGDPIWQIFEFDAPFYADKGPSWLRTNADAVFFGQEVDVSTNEDGLLPHELSDASLKKLGYEKFNKFIIDLFQSDFCRKILDLSEEQTAQLPDIDRYVADYGILQGRGGIETNMIWVPAPGMLFFQQHYISVPKEKLGLPTKIEEFLTDEQQDRFRRLIYQASIVRNNRGVTDLRRFISVSRELDKRTKTALQSLIVTSGIGTAASFRDPRSAAYILKGSDHKQGSLGSRFIRDHVRNVLKERQRISMALNDELKQILDQNQRDSLLELLGQQQRRAEVN